MAAQDAAIAANRFGLGARPGELQHMGSAARDALLGQLKGPAPTLAESLPATSETLAQVIAAREARRNAPDDKDPTVQVALKLRNIYVPVYANEVVARFRAAVASQRSFLERLTHFWSNHFAVSVDKLVVLGLAGGMEREAIRPHVLGSFPQMLLAVEQHPAMLLYLDNHVSIGPGSRAAQLAGRRSDRKVGINENLGREILELHTLGVGSGYTQQDVQSLAAIITGWSIGGYGAGQRGGEPGQFFFREVMHEPGGQTLLGRRYGENDVSQGEAALKALAVDRRTAHHISTKLARHFIADDPPATAVDRMTSAWLKTEGDLPSVYRALLESHESWSTPLAKFKTPADYIHSTFRALDLPVAPGRQSLQVFELLGQRSFQPGSPAGWADTSADWDGSAALLKRVEWAQSIAQKSGAGRRADEVAAEALGATLGAETLRAIERAQDASQALTLFLGSPEFMRR
jgi:uncharacterized protein (DUF1800 family)